MLFAARKITPPLQGPIINATIHTTAARLTNEHLLLAEALFYAASVGTTPFGARVFRLDDVLPWMK